MKKLSGWRLPPFLTLILVLGALLLSGAFIQRTLAADSVTPESKIEPLVLEQVAAEGTTDFFIWMTETADLSPAYAMNSKLEKGTFVFNALRETAEASQQELRAYLDGQGITYQPFYIANKVLVLGGSGELVQAVAARPDVARITANHVFQLDEPFIDPNPPEVVGSNIAFVNANDVWALGYNGAGTVLAGNDTGLDWDHPALINQ
jgi:subtilisin family serine protease